MPASSYLGHAPNFTRKRHTWAVLMMALFVFGGSLRAADVPNAASPSLDLDKQMAELKFAAEVARSEIHKKYTAQRKALVEKYAGAVDKIGQEFQKKGDLTSVLIAREEIEHARENLSAGKSEFPALDSLREILAKQLESIASAEATDLKLQAQSEVPGLEATKVALTKAGRLDDAVKVQKEIDERKAILAGETSPKPTATLESAPSEALPALEIPDSRDDVVEKSVVLKRGLYDLRHKRITVGIEGKSEADLTVEADSLMKDGELFVTAGSFTADGCYFEDVQFSADLSAPMTYSDSLFQECTFRKGGGWFVKVFSSKWIFRNCVFSESFVEPWKTGGVGVQIFDCTFLDVDFSEITYREDAASEAIHEWMTIKNCEFVRCKVPESLLIATEDCVFTDCRFATSRYPAGQPLSATILTAGSTPVEVRTSSNATITTKPAGEQAGSTLDYEYVDGRLGKVGN